MANSFSNLVANAYKALDVVSRELVGFVNSVTLDADYRAVPIGQTLYSFETPAAATSTITPAATPPALGDTTVGSQALTITKSKGHQFYWTGEEGVALNRGAGMLSINQAKIAQAIRALVNEMETDVWVEAYSSASRAYGTAGTTPFASTLEDAAQMRKILDDNGADGARSLIINTAAGVNLRKLTQLTKANEAGSAMTLRDGELLDLFGFSVKESAAGASAVTKGTGSGYLTNSGTTNAIGDTVIPADTGTGTILAGDIVTFAADTTNKYVVTSALSGGSFTIGSPGLRVAIPDGNAITVVGNSSRNVAFSQTAIALGARTPYVPEGDLAQIHGLSEIITDPRSGLSFRLAKYPGYHAEQYEISAAWGVAGIKPAHTAVLLG